MLLVELCCFPGQRLEQSLFNRCVNVVCSLIMGTTRKICRMCFVLINNILLNLSCLPWYNHNGWLGEKFQLTYLSCVWINLPALWHSSGSVRSTVICTRTGLHLDPLAIFPLLFSFYFVAIKGDQGLALCTNGSGVDMLVLEPVRVRC